MDLQLRYWALQTVAMMVTAFLIPRLTISSPLGPLAMVIALSFINTHYWDAALFFQLPTSATTNALLLLLANGVIFWVLVKVLPGIEIQGFLPALAAPIVFTVSSVLINQYGREIDWVKVWEATKPVIAEVKQFFISIKSPAPAVS